MTAPVPTAPGSGPRRQGRRPGDPEVTRQAILTAARRRFGEVGFEQATIRTIAERAGVDPALVIHHFKNKATLFAAANELPFNPTDLLTDIALRPREQRGELITRAYLTMMATPDGPGLSLMRSAASNHSVAVMLREFIEHTVHHHAVSLTDRPDAPLRAALVASHLVGVAFVRCVVQLPEIADLTMDDLIALVAPTVQRYLDDPALPRRSGPS